MRPVSKPRNPLARIAAAGIGLLAAGAAFAQPAYPSKPIRMIIPFSPGSASDFLVRVLAIKLSERYGQQVIPDNRPGGGGVIGSQIAARAAPDGYTLVMVAAPHIVNALIHTPEPYRPVDDFTPIAQVATLPNLLAISLQVPAKTVQEFIAFAKARPGQMNLGSAGVGSASHVSGELFRLAAGIDSVHVPFKLFSDALVEMYQGRVHFYVAPITAMAPPVRDGRLRALAVTSRKRHALLPEVPTMAEVGVPDATIEFWFGIAGPAGLPAALVARLNADLAAVLKDPDTIERFAKQGADALHSSPGAFAALMRSETLRLRDIVQRAGIKARQ